MLHTLRLDLYSSLESVLHFHRFLTWSHGTYYLLSEEFLSTGIREQKYVEGKKPAQADVLRVWLRSSCPVTCCDHAQIALRLGWLNRLRPPTMGDYEPAESAEYHLQLLSSYTLPCCSDVMWCRIPCYALNAAFACSSSLTRESGKGRISSYVLSPRRLQPCCASLSWLFPVSALSGKLTGSQIYASRAPRDSTLGSRTFTFTQPLPSSSAETKVPQGKTKSNCQAAGSVGGLWSMTCQRAQIISNLSIRIQNPSCSMSTSGGWVQAKPGDGGFLGILQSRVLFRRGTIVERRAPPPAPLLCRIFQALGAPEG